MKKTKIFLTMALTVILALCGCSHDNNTDNSGTENVKVNKAVNNAEAALGNTYQNLVMPEAIEVDKAEKAYILSASRKNESLDVKAQLEKLCEAYTGSKPDSIYRDEGSSNTFIGEINGKYHIEYSSSNSFHAYRLAEWRAEEEKLPCAVYDVSNEDISSVSYKVANSDYSLSEALNYAEGFVKDKLMEFMPNDTDISFSKAFVYKSGEHYFYCFTARHYIEGLPLSNVGTGSIEEAHMNGTEFRIYIDEPGIIGEIRNFRYPYITEKQEVSELISLDSALSYLEGYLAPYGKYDIKNITLEYCSKDNSDKGDSFVYHPTWCFTLSEYDANIYQLEPKKMLYLDAVNKEVFCWDDTKSEFVFGDNIKLSDK